MDVRYNIKDGCVIFYIDSNIELFIADDLKHNILKVIQDTSLNKIVLNLDSVEFMDSMGIAMLLQVKHLSNPKVEIRICNAHASIQRLLEVTNLYKLIPSDVNEEMSIKKLNQM
jgi:anti-anti-sigma factor